MGKKNLEQLFKDAFKDFQETPDEKVWDSIEATLDKKKQKRRVIPIWWRLGGVAALLAILFYITNPLDTPQGGEETITEIEQPETVPGNEDYNQENLNTETETISEGFEKQILTDVSEDAEDGANQNSSLTSVDRTQPTLDKKSTSKNQDKGIGAVKNEASIASTDSETEEEEGLGKDGLSIAEVVEQVDSSNNTNEEPSSLESTGMDEAVAEKNKGNKNDNKKDASDILKSVVKDEEVLAEKTVEEEETNKRSIFEVIAEQEDEAELADASQEKWSVGPSVAPVYFNGSGEGSPIHSNFASNSKSGNVNLSYGLTVSYSIGKRLKIRSGVHRVNYGYDTNEVLFSSSLDGSTSQTIDNINYSETSRTLVVQSKNSVQTNALNDASVELAANEVPALEGKMVQQLGYIEVPLELNYTLVDKKLGVDIIGGVSSLFLVENSVLLESQDLVTEMGEANNANSVNYSTNIGVGFNYEISPKLQFNLEPVFKYQLNTFSETAGPFRPYSVGVYSGVSFRF